MADRLIRPIRIEGNLAYVPLSRGREAVIDAPDVALVSNFNWSVCANRKCLYAQTWNGGNPLRLHRVLMNHPADMCIDHINGDGLDNRRSNLRLATVAENNRNARIRKDNATGVRGVTRHRLEGKWVARIKANKRDIHLGVFDTIDDAAAAYEAASAKLHGVFANADRYERNDHLAAHKPLDT